MRSSRHRSTGAVPMPYFVKNSENTVSATILPSHIRYVWMLCSLNIEDTSRNKPSWKIITRMRHASDPQSFARYYRGPRVGGVFDYATTESYGTNLCRNTGSSREKVNYGSISADSDGFSSELNHLCVTEDES